MKGTAYVTKANGFISCHILPLVIYSLGDRHTHIHIHTYIHTHTNKHADNPHKTNFKNQALRSGFTEQLLDGSLTYMWHLYNLQSIYKHLNKEGMAT